MTKLYNITTYAEIREKGYKLHCITCACNVENKLDGKDAVRVMGGMTAPVNVYADEKGNEYIVL